MDKKTPSNKGKIIGSVIGAAAGVAAIAAGHYFYGKNGKEHRKQASDWTKQAKTDMLAKIRQMKIFTKATYDKAAAEVLAKYKQVKNIDPMELQNFGQELKKHWTKISKQAAKLTNKSVVNKPAIKA